MQGRLVPPVDGKIQAFPAARWRDEFPLAAAAGLDAIEWVYDAPSVDAGTNPLATAAGRREILDAARSGVAVRSVCADYFMDHRLLDEPGALAHLRAMLPQCREVGATRVVLPFVDQSGVAVRDFDRLVSVLSDALPAASAAGVELHLETALGPDDFAALLARLPDPLIKVNYDSGNSASLGFHPDDEFAAYGARVGSVHVKDRVRGGGTVPLGAGDADLPAFAGALRRVGYDGDVVLQIARGVEGDEAAWAAKNLAAVRRLLGES
jgi:hexulose-6-phosphate isomerase